MNAFIKIESVWEDEDLFEVRISASNGPFQGKARCYTTREEIGRLASELSGFPAQVSDTAELNTYAGDSFSFFCLSFFCTDPQGHVVAKVKVADIQAASNTRRQESVAEFEVPTEAEAIAGFSKGLQHLSESELGVVCALLRGAT